MMNNDDSIAPKQNIQLEALLRAYIILEDVPGTKISKLTKAFVQTLEAGYWRPNEEIPKETQLAAALPVSLGTVQSAMRKLVDNGIIERRRRSGSRIAPIKEKDGNSLFLRFLDFDRVSLAQVDPVEITLGETTEQGWWSNFLGELVSYVHIRRTFSVLNHIPVAALIYLDAGRFRPLLDYNPESIQRLHIRHVLQDRFNCPILKIKKNISISNISSDIANQINLGNGQPALIIEVRTTTLHDKPLFIQRFYIPPNDHWIDVEG